MNYTIPATAVGLLPLLQNLTAKEFSDLASGPHKDEFKTAITSALSNCVDLMQETVIFPGSNHDKANRDCLAKAKPNEPKFVLLGSDPDAGNLVRLWAERREAAGSGCDPWWDTDRIGAALDTAQDMDEWYNKGNKEGSAPHVSRYLPFPGSEKSFHDLAMRTAAGPENWFPEDKSPLQFVESLLTYVSAARDLDRWKSRLIYGKEKADSKYDTLPRFDVRTNDALTFVGKHPEFVHAVLGIGSEAGELAEILLSTAATDDEISVTNVLEETGDLFWFSELLARFVHGYANGHGHYGHFDPEHTTPGDVTAIAKQNVIAKLTKRYPDTYSQDHAVLRLDKA